jgi:hypothetical protein
MKLGYFSIHVDLASQIAGEYFWLRYMTDGYECIHGRSPAKALRSLSIPRRIRDFTVPKDKLRWAEIS